MEKSWTTFFELTRVLRSQGNQVVQNLGKVGHVQGERIVSTDGLGARLPGPSRRQARAGCRLQKPEGAWAKASEVPGAANTRESAFSCRLLSVGTLWALTEKIFRDLKQPSLGCRAGEGRLVSSHYGRAEKFHLEASLSFLL